MPHSFRRYARGLLGLLMISVLWASFSGSVRAQSRSEPRVLSLDEAIDLAVKFSPQIREEQFGVLKRQSQRAQASAARFAQFDITIVGGISPRARGDQLSSEDSKADPVINGAFGLATFTLIQPLYTFGKINNLRQAAAHGVAVSKAQVHEKATEVALLVYEAYYGHQLALALENLALEINDQLTATIEKVKRQLEAGAPGVDNIDRLKLETFLGELEKQLNDIRQGKELALVGLRTLTGLDPNLPITLAETTLRPVAQEVPPLDASLTDARQLRPEFNQAREGIKAFEKLAQAAKADFYPVFFAGVIGGLAEASNRDRVDNPFIDDVLKDDFATPVLGLRWHFDFGITAAKVDEVEAELGQIQEKHAFAEQGIPFQVRQAYLELEQHRANIEATRKGYRSARQWLVAAVSNFDLGVGEGKDVADAALAYATLRANYLQSVYNFNLGLAKVENTSGRDVSMIQSLLPPLPERR